MSESQLIERRKSIGPEWKRIYYQYLVSTYYLLI